jgi:hypothetical protein
VRRQGTFIGDRPKVGFIIAVIDVAATERTIDAH